MATRATVGVVPTAQLRRRPLLFAALELVFDVRFEGRDPGQLDGLAAVVAFGSLETPHAAKVPLLAYPPSGEPAVASRSVVTFGHDEAVDARLRGHSLSESRVGANPARLGDGVPLARDDLGPVWTRDPASGAQRCLLAPDELAADEPLRDRLRADRFLELLPLVELLRRVTGYETWRRPPARAAFVFDDPNLHWPTYGHIRYAELARHAREHGYHAVMALIPLDAWYAHPAAARHFRAGEPLSLTMHGNDHVFHELEPSVALRDGARLFRQAIRRVSRLERSTGLEVSRVMVPPHERCSDEMMEAMLEPGIEAVCRAPTWWAAWPQERLRTARWHMADVAPSGMPVLGRHPLSRGGSGDDALLNVYLDQPAILYGHHVDVADGYEVLTDAAARLDRVGPVEWGSLGSIAAGNVLVRADGVVQHVRLFSRSAEVEVAPDARELRVELPHYERFEQDSLVHAGRAYELAAGDGRVGATIPVEGAARASLRLERETGEEPRDDLRPAPRAVVRRTTRELRDRAHPSLRRVGLDRAVRWLETVYVGRMNARGARKRNPR